MKQNFRLIVLVMFCMFITSRADAWIGYYMGPICTFYPQPNYSFSKANPGFGVQGGFLFITNTSAIVSFRMDFAFNWSQSRAVFAINRDLYGLQFNRLEGTVNVYGVILSPKLQFNFLEERGAFINFGLAPRLVRANGEGTAYRSDGVVYTSEGKDFSPFFKKFTVAMNIGVGYQEIRIGSVTMFAELTESYDISTITYTSMGPSIRALTTSLNIGIRLYKNDSYSTHSNEYR
jgi:hypothetical protein